MELIRDKKFQFTKSLSDKMAQLFQRLKSLRTVHCCWHALVPLPWETGLRLCTKRELSLTSDNDMAESRTDDAISAGSLAFVAAPLARPKKISAIPWQAV